MSGAITPKHLEGEVIKDPKNKFERSLQQYQILADTIGDLDGKVSSTEAAAVFMELNYELNTLKSQKPECAAKIKIDHEITHQERKLLGDLVKNNVIDAINTTLDDIEFANQIQFYRDKGMYGKEEPKDITKSFEAYEMSKVAKEEQKQEAELLKSYKKILKD